MKTSPTQRSKRYLERRGYRVAIVERWNPFAHIRQDLYGAIDLLAMKAGAPLIAVQTTTAGNLCAREQKKGMPETVAVWRATGNRFEFHGWAKRGARGKRKLWVLIVRDEGGERRPSV